MVKKLGVFGLVILMAITFSAPVIFAEGPRKVPNGPAGKSPIGRLYLFEKDPATWEIIWDGAWGKMIYRQWGPKFRFNFNGHGLEPGWKYTLIYYPDPWPGNDLICFGEGTADEYGNVHIKGRVETGNLPAMYDKNYPDGAKIWLVLTDDVQCGDTTKMVGWNPTEYLFEYNLITYTEKD